MAEQSLCRLFHVETGTRSLCDRAPFASVEVALFQGLFRCYYSHSVFVYILCFVFQETCDVVVANEDASVLLRNSSVVRNSMFL